jgi:outer membrane protein assembly factor BamB
MGGAEFADDRILGVNISPSRDKLSLWALSLKPGQEGQVIFNTSWDPPVEWAEGVNVIYLGAVTSNGDGGVFTIWNKELRKHYAFSLDTGVYLWETEPEHYLQGYGARDAARSWIFSDGKLYSLGVAGILYCYDINDGSILWTYNVEDSYNEFLFANDWWSVIMFISDGKIYFSHLEHSPIDPKPRGAPFMCLDAETGDVIWTIDGMFRHGQWGGNAIIGDSIIATMDVYDQRIYAVGKGPSQTTVDAPKNGISEGSSVVISGSVTDISAGTNDPSITARFPNGVACVADEDMSEWMKYVYKQFPMPNAAGVDVTLDVIDSNGNFRNIGIATTDASGYYAFNWTPDILGMYTVISTFAGSEAYYASYSEAAFAVDKAPDPTPPPPDPTPLPPTETYITGSTIAIIAAIAVAVILILRKK